jgi:hypothetical protein
MDWMAAVSDLHPGNMLLVPMAKGLLACLFVWLLFTYQTMRTGLHADFIIIIMGMLLLKWLGFLQIIINI